jgi:hypothetical protein
MLFGSAAVFAILLASGTFSSVRPSPCPWGPAAQCGRPLAAPLPALDLRQMASPAASSTDALRRQFPLEVKSVKVCGASGFGVFAPIFDEVFVGASVSAYKITPHERVTQTVVGVRVRF